MEEAIKELIGNGGYIGILLGTIVLLFIVMLKSVKFSVLSSKDSAGFADRLLNFIILVFIIGSIGALSLEAFKTYDNSTYNQRGLNQLESELKKKEEALADYESALSEEAKRQELFNQEIDVKKKSIDEIGGNPNEGVIIDLLASSYFPSVTNQYESKVFLKEKVLHTDFKTGLKVYIDKIDKLANTISLYLQRGGESDKGELINYKVGFNSFSAKIGNQEYILNFEFPEIEVQSNSVFFHLIQKP